MQSLLEVYVSQQVNSRSNITHNRHLKRLVHIYPAALKSKNMREWWDSGSASLVLRSIKPIQEQLLPYLRSWHRDYSGFEFGCHLMCTGSSKVWRGRL